MKLSRWQPFNEVWNPLEQFRREMNRLFENFGQGFTPATGAFPQLNLWEDGEAVLVEAELPGVDQKDLEIYVTGGNQLTIKGQRKQPELPRGVWHRQERVFGEFSRTVTLPFLVDAEKVESHLRDGVLTIRLPKHESARPRKIAVKGE